MKFLIDNQLPQALAVYLKSRGHDCSHVIELSLDEADDVELWARGIADGAILISKDEDFIFLATRVGGSGRLVWVRLGNCRNASLISAFDRAHEEIIQAFESGQRIIELR
jgi:predicted nuclease of predicted toxin-antitoxin system